MTGMKDKEVLDFFGLGVTLGTLAVLVSPIRLTRRQRLARWGRRVLLRQTLPPIPAKGAAMIQAQSRGISELLDAVEAREGKASS